MMDASARYSAHPRALLTVLEDGTGVLLSLQNHFYYTLNATGIAVWKRLQEGAASPEELAAVLTSAFVVELAAARTDVDTLLADLLDEGLVQRLPR